MCSSRRTPSRVSAATRRSHARPAAEELRNAVGPAQIQMRVVLPGDADAAEHLNAVLGVGLGGSIAGRGRDGRGDRQLAVVVAGGSGRGGRRASAATATCSRAQQHLGAHVLDRLEAADRLAELLAHLRVLGGGLQRPAGQPGGLGRQHRRGQIGDALRRHVEHGGRRGVEHHPRQRAGEVGGLQPLHRSPRRRRVDQQPPSPPAGSSSTPAASRPAHIGGARDPAVGVGQLRAQRRPGGALAGHQRLEHVGGHVGAPAWPAQWWRPDRAPARRRPRRPSRTDRDSVPPAPPSVLGHRHAEDAQFGQAAVGPAPGVGFPLPPRGPRRWRRLPDAQLRTSSRAADCSSVMVADNVDS